MNPSYFISDVHIGISSGKSERKRQDLLLNFLGEVRRHNADLYIVGDLFDFWYEYRHVVPRGVHRILAALEDLVRHGSKVTYFAGNHDFAIGSALADDIGIHLAMDSLGFSIGDANFFVCHGDGLDKRDIGYRLLKRILRNRLAQWCFRWLHPDLGFSLAGLTSKSSRRYTENKAYGDGMRRAAEKLIAAGTDYVIMGHSHQPVIERIDSGHYINLGDWLSNFTYAVYRDRDMQLLTYKNGFEEKPAEH